MNEHHYIAFRAIHRPLSPQALEQVTQQASGADVSAWTFLHQPVGEFEGNALGLLRQGYDVHVEYASSGKRMISMRLPYGLPYAPEVWTTYGDFDSLQWLEDPNSKAGTLTLEQPSKRAESSARVPDPSTMLNQLVVLRDQLMAGDLRGLYLLWLCASAQAGAAAARKLEPPVPGGINESREQLGDLLLFFGLDPLILEAAAEIAPGAPAVTQLDDLVTDWLEGLHEQFAKAALGRVLRENAGDVKAELLADIRQTRELIDWPTAPPSRSLTGLVERAKELRAERALEEGQHAAASLQVAADDERRQQRLREMMLDPLKWLREAEKLADARGNDNYRAAASILADLREAIMNEPSQQITLKHAAHLTKKHPALRHLESALRKEGLMS